MSDNAIEIRGLVKRFPGFELGPIDLTVPKGAIYGFIGPNAAGKTTTIDLILGMGREEAGEIRVFDLDHRRDEVEVKKWIGYVSPDLSYAAWGKVKRLIHFMRPFYPYWDDDYCETLMGKLGIGWDDKIAAMSFGTRVKLNLLIALSHRPTLLLLDEPTLGVDAVSKQEIFAELLEAVQEEDRTVLISSHGLSDIERFTDHIGVIDNGKLLLEGPTSDIVERYKMVDLRCETRDALPKIEGVLQQSRSDDRVRALVDTESVALDWMKAAGVEEVGSTPVTLEELFIALVKGN